jgi:hypothetical protein
MAKFSLSMSFPNFLYPSDYLEANLKDNIILSIIISVSLTNWICSFYFCVSWGYIVAFLQVLTIRSNISYVNFSPLLFSFLRPLISWIVSTDIILAFAYMYTHFLHTVHPSNPFAQNLPHNWCQPSPWVWVLSLPVLQFCRRKKRKEKWKNMTF